MGLNFFLSLPGIDKMLYWCLQGLYFFSLPGIDIDIILCVYRCCSFFLWHVDQHSL